MTPLYCSKGHENATTNLFCQQCGEKLGQPAGKGVYPGLILGDRYRIVRLLGQGGFGRTYLAEDINRFKEPCVLKEFAPQVRGTYAQQKAEELFEREAGTLYKLKHPQIPCFRELFRAKLDDKGYLFLVQDFVEGQTYRALLDARKRQGQRFGEAEVTQFLLQLLPVLEYVHSLGVIHRDISPDNLIWRSADWLPVLIDFGGVKQVAAEAESQFTQSAAGMVPSRATRLGKIGYAPNEQMQIGVVYPHSDLYALAATVLVLLTGKEPQQLIDQHTLNWNWRREISVSPTLGAILDKMLSYRPGDRFQSAREVLQALGATPTPGNLPPTGPTVPPTPPPIPAPPPAPPTEATRPIVPPIRQTPVNPIPPSPASNQVRDRGWSSLLLTNLLIGCLAVLGIGGISWMIGKIGNWQSSRPQPTVQPTTPATKDPEPPPDPKFSAAEIARKDALRDRRRDLGIDYNFYVALVNESFWNRFPNQRGRTLSDDPKDAPSREEWDKTASEWLNNLRFLSAAARQRLGSYSQADRDRWKEQVNNLKLSSRALYDLADAEFFYRFPQQQGRDFLNKPIGQVWNAIALDKVSAVQSGDALKRIVFDPGAIGKEVSGTLKPGEARAYIAGLAEGQLMKVNLTADRSILLSVYPPTSDQKALLEDSTKRTWSGTLQQNGFYEFVVISKAAKSSDYRLNLTAENIAPPPSPEPTPTTPSSPEPSPSPSPPIEPSPTTSPSTPPTETPTEPPIEPPTETSPTPSASPSPTDSPVPAPPDSETSP